MKRSADMQSGKPSTFVCASILLLATHLLTGCMPARRELPALARVTVPDSWTTQPYGTGGESRINAQWWQRFGDTALSSHVEAALVHNSDLLAAASRVDAARAQARLSDSALGPTLSAVAGVQADRTLSSNGIATSRAAQPNLQAAWELDLWGRLRAQASAAELQFRATQADRDAAALSVSATTAQTYIGLLALEAQLAQTRDTATSRAEALRIAQDKARVGYTSQLQLTQAESEYEAVLQTIPQLETSLARQYNALRLLTGELPGRRDPAAGQSSRLENLLLPPVPVTLPSELLRRRPDIAQAERQLAASDALLAASRSAFLPQLSLSASWGALYVNALDYDPIGVWRIGGSILAPIFDQGRLSAQYDTAIAQRDQAAFGYRGAALAAFGDVENALVGVSRLTQQMEHVTRRRAILARSLDHARERYDAGYAPYLEQLDAQRSLYQTEIEVINIRQSQLLNLVDLYKAMGGGWSAEISPSF